MSDPNSDLAELRRLEAAATPAPWSGSKGLDSGCRVVRPRKALYGVDLGWYIATCHVSPSDGDNAAENAALIVAARNALPALLDRLEAAEYGVNRIQSFQPPGSPPPGDISVLVEWILGSIQDRAKAAERERDEARAEALEQEEAKECAYQKMYDLIRERDAAVALGKRCAAWMDSAGLEDSAAERINDSEKILSDLQSAGWLR